MSKKIAVITGATRGIGKVTAIELIKQGWSIVNISRQPSDLAFKNLSADFTQKDWLKPIENDLNFALQGAERITLIHNAFFYVGEDRVDHFDEAVLDQEITANFKAPMLLNKLIIPLMPKHSSVIYLGSTLSEKAVSDCFCYVTLKHAVVGMMRATCQDLMGRFIHTVCVCPGMTETEMLVQHLGADREALEKAKSAVSENRLIQPQEIASVIVYAVEHSVLNGAVIHANLGQIES